MVAHCGSVSPLYDENRTLAKSFPPLTAFVVFLNQKPAAQAAHHKNYSSAHLSVRRYPHQFLDYPHSTLLYRTAAWYMKQETK